MTGAAFRAWAKDSGLLNREGVRVLADKMKRSPSTVYNRFNKGKLAHHELAELAAAGVEPARIALSKDS